MITPHLPDDIRGLQLSYCENVLVYSSFVVTLAMERRANTPDSWGGGWGGGGDGEEDLRVEVVSVLSEDLHKTIRVAVTLGEAAREGKVAIIGGGGGGGGGGGDMTNITGRCCYCGRGHYKTKYTHAPKHTCMYSGIMGGCGH